MNKYFPNIFQFLQSSATNLNRTDSLPYFFFSVDSALKEQRCREGNMASKIAVACDFGT